MNTNMVISRQYFYYMRFGRLLIRFLVKITILTKPRRAFEKLQAGKIMPSDSIMGTTDVQCIASLCVFMPALIASNHGADTNNIMM